MATTVEWTPVSERLPELSGQYLVTEEFAFMRIVSINTFLTEYVAGCFENKKQYSGSGFYEFVCPGHYEKNDCVVAWAELPDIYQADWEEIEWTFGEQ